MRIIVTGSRNWTDKDLIRKAIIDNGATTIIHGGAKGADTLADEIAHELGLPVELYTAKWAIYGKAAGPVRNQEMIDKSSPDLVLAFPMIESKGTWDMVRRAQKANVKTLIFNTSTEV